VLWRITKSGVVAERWAQIDLASMLAQLDTK